ncbi:MAG TPA: 2-C-methyl-D-erythritol 4-phosphate cytidylyltransferase [Candidatus Kapabacteria bacterium]
MMSVIAIIVAAGSGSRFGKPKQFELLGGEPVFIHSVRAFLLCKRVDKIVLVTSEELIDEMNSLLEAKSVGASVSVTIGGERRQDSVMNGLISAHAGDDDVILVHDAARPLVSQKVINDVIDATITHGAALAAVEVVDTLKREEGGFATDTVNREHLWRAQTPQAAKVLSLRNALEHAQNEGVTGTDEAQLLSLISVRSYLVSSDERNFKITYPDDLARAEALL